MVFMHYLSEKNIMLFLFQLFIILFFARSIGELFRKFKQPVITAELLIGVLLGPTILGRFFPQISAIIFPIDVVQQSMLETVSWVGVLFLLLDTGLEIDFSSAWRQKGNALIIAFSDIIIPMAIAFIPCMFLSDVYLVNVDQRIQFALFMAVVSTISDIPITSRVLHELKILKTDSGYLIMSALAVNDIVGWVLFTIILGMFMQTALNLGNILFVFLATIGFSTLALTFGRDASNKAIDFFHRRNLAEPSASFTFACLLGLLFGAITQAMGIHALFGFFIAGIIVGEAKNLKAETRTVISQMVHSLFIPVFFVNIGLKIDFFANFDLFLVSLMTFLGVFGRFIGAWLGVSFSKVPKVNRNIISIAHTPGGMMGIVVALLALETGLITQSVFIAVVFSSLFSSAILGPWMRYAINRREKIKILDFLSLKQGLQILGTNENKCSVMNSMIFSLPNLAKKIQIDKMFKDAMCREEEFSTAVGEAIAIPHIRLDGISDPILLFALSKQGIEWNAPDGKPVNFVFFLFSPMIAKDLHIEILSKIVKIMQNKDNQAKILQAEDLKDLAKVCENIFV